MAFCIMFVYVSPFMSTAVFWNPFEWEFSSKPSHFQGFQVKVPHQGSHSGVLKFQRKDPQKLSLEGWQPRNSHKVSKIGMTKFRYPMVPCMSRVSGQIMVVRWWRRVFQLCGYR